MNISRGLISVGAVLAMACHASGYAPPTTTGASIDTTQNERALRQLVAERCAHEVNCGDVGKGHVDASYDACVSRTRPPTRDALLTSGCATAVDDARLSRCVDAIRSESCGSPGTPITDVAACGVVDLCH